MGLFALSHLVLLLTAGLARLTSAHMAIHHTVVSASNLNRSLEFYTQGIGLDIIRKAPFIGDLKTLFGSDSTTLPGYFLGDASCGESDVNGILYLVEFDDVHKNPSIYAKKPQTGLFLTSFWLGDQFNATLARLKSMGMGGKPHIATFGDNPRATYATVRDPDGSRVLLVSRPYLTPFCPPTTQA